MLQNLLKFKGVKALNKEEKKKVNGGYNSGICILGGECSFGSSGPVPVVACLVGPEGVEFLECIDGVWVYA